MPAEYPPASGTVETMDKPQDIAEAFADESECADCANPAPRRGVLSRFGLARSQGFEPRDWMTLLVTAFVVATCGVLGVSYVAGQGWHLFDGATTVLLIIAMTAVFALVFCAAETGLYHVATQCRADGEAECAGGSSPLDASAAVADASAGADVDAPAGVAASATVDAGAASAGDAASAATADASASLAGAEARSASRRFRLARLTPSWSAKSIAVFSLVMALFWLPWLIANFPGGTYWDTYYQIFQCYPENHPIAVIPYAECYDNTLTDAYLCDHHPILDTLIYGAFGMASDALTGNWMAGVFAFVCLQGAATIVAFVTAIAYLRRRNCPVVLCFAAYLFFCIMPFVSTWALCMVKDSLFALVFVPYMIMLFEAVRTRGSSLVSPRAIALFALLGVLLCLTKKTGLYVVVPAALIAAWVYRPRGRARRELARARRLAGGAAVNAGAGGAFSCVGGSAPCEEAAVRAEAGGAAVRQSVTGKDGGSFKPLFRHAHFHRHRRDEARVSEGGASSFRARVRSCGASGAAGFLVQAIACVLVMCVVMPAAVFPLLNVAPGGKQEVLGVLFQQTARHVTYYGNDVTDEEREAIDAVLEYDNLPDQYTFNFQDEVKYRFKLDATNEDLLRYLGVWAAQGMRHPESYLASVMSIAGYYLAPCGIVNIRMVTVDTHMGDDNRYMLYNPDELDWLRNGLDEAYTIVARIPGLDIPVLLVTYVFWLPAVLLLAMWRRRLRCGVLFVPIAITVGFCVIAPVYDARYCIPLLYMAPLLVCMVATLVRSGDLGAVARSRSSRQ